MKERAKVLFLALIVVLMTQTTGIMLGMGDASEDEAPFFVRLEIFVDPKNLSLAGTAGGSLISDRHILTAAHSLVRMKTNKGFLVAYIRGKSEILALRVEAVEVLIHPLFISKNKNETRADNDVAIITLPVPLINCYGFKTIPYETDPYEYFDNKLVKIYGFGRNSREHENVDIMCHISVIRHPRRN